LDAFGIVHNNAHVLAWSSAAAETIDYMWCVLMNNFTTVPPSGIIEKHGFPTPISSTLHLQQIYRISHHPASATLTTYNQILSYCSQFICCSHSPQ
jgi:hypothetical protein